MNNIYPIATPRGTLRARHTITEARHVRVRLHIWDDDPTRRHPGVANEGDALLVITTDTTEMELLLSGSEIEPMTDALLACVAQRHANDRFLSATPQQAAAMWGAA